MMPSAIVTSSLLVSMAAAAVSSPAPIARSGWLLAIPTCTAECLPAAALLHEYADAAPKIRGVYTIGVHASPWRLYDGDGRILTPHGLAQLMRSDPDLSLTKTIRLAASWSAGGWPEASPPLAQQLSNELRRPVEGVSGFLWWGPSGPGEVTYQTSTSFMYPYRARRGEAVMASATVALSDAVLAEAERHPTGKDFRWIGVSDDVFLIRPEVALGHFRRAAELGDSVGAYDAALILLGKGAKDGTAEARRLLEQASAAGDKPSQDLLQSLPRS